MHKLYLEKYETDVYNKMQNDEETKTTVKYDFYCRFFADNFNIFIIFLDIQELTIVKHVMA